MQVSNIGAAITATPQTGRLAFSCARAPETGKPGTERRGKE